MTSCHLHVTVACTSPTCFSLVIFCAQTCDAAPTERSMCSLLFVECLFTLTRHFHSLSAYRTAIGDSTKLPFCSCSNWTNFAAFTYRSGCCCGLSQHGTAWNLMDARQNQLRGMQMPCVTGKKSKSIINKNPQIYTSYLKTFTSLHHKTR